MKHADTKPLFYQIPANKRGVVLATLATALAVVSIIWGSFIIWDRDNGEGVTKLGPTSSSPTPQPTVTVAPKAPKPQTPTIIQMPGRTVVITSKPAPVPPATPVTVVPIVPVVPAPVVVVPPTAPSACLDLTKLLAPGCRLL